MNMVEAVFEELPDKPLEFVIEYLHKQTGKDHRYQLQSLRAINAELRHKLNMSRLSAGEIVEAVTDEGKPDKSESEEEESDDDDADVEAAAAEAMKVKALQRGPRQSVSAEAYGDWNIKTIVKTPEYAKTEEQQARLTQTLNRSFLFNGLLDKDLNIIVKAMQETIFSPGDRIITEGEDGFDLFVIEEGSPECSKLIDGVKKVVKTCQPGDVFGELALLYNCPRAATVETPERCVCWRLDRETFNCVVREAAIKRSAQYDQFIKDVPLLSACSAQERELIVDALKCDKYMQGEYVVKQGETGDRFYMVEEGTLCAMKLSGSNPETRNVNEYSKGMYFGELALLKNQARAASVVVTSPVAKVVSLDRKCFMNLVGSVSEMLQRQVASYGSEGSWHGPI